MAKLDHDNSIYIHLKSNAAQFTPSGHSAQTGLRQGDPLSPLLLILAIDPLNRLLQVAIERGFLMKFNGRAARFRVFMYADDAVIFLKPTITDVCNLDMLLNFGAVIRLQTI
jgi:hypothetical protein